jgi:alpha-ketoglutarate-dependent taurine dioxygenase
MALVTEKLTPRIGTEIKADLKMLMSAGAGAEIRAILEQRGVVVVRGLNLTDEQQLAFAATLGHVRDGKLKKKQDDGSIKVTSETDGGQGIFKVTFDTTQNVSYAHYLVGTFSWHMDGTWEPVPPLASILTPRILSPTGGQTEFANTYAAYDELPEADKKLFETLKVVHVQKTAYVETIPNMTPEQIKDFDSYPVQVHPLVWKHHSGRKSIAFSSSADHIEGMPAKKSDALIERIRNWVTQRQFVYQHSWKMGDMLMWDNTGTMHRVLRFDMNCGRRLHRVTLEGEESLAA